MEKYIVNTPEAALTKGERIEKGIWRPGIMDRFTDKLGVGSTTKLTEVRAPGARHLPQLRITSDPSRVIEDRDELEASLKAKNTGESVDDFRGRKVAAGMQLTRMLRNLDLEANPRDMLKTRLTHGTNIVLVDKEYLALPKAEQAMMAADGLITRMKHIPIMVAAADCAPIIIYDPKTETVGVFHAGYRGTVAGIARKGIETMAREYQCKPEDLIVSVGPYADGDSYEIDTGLLEQFRNQKNDDGEPAYTEDDLKKMFKPHPTDVAKVMYDNGEAIRLQAEKAGVNRENIEVSQLSTMKDNELLSSDRKEGFNNRDTLMAMAVLK